MNSHDEDRVYLKGWYQLDFWMRDKNNLQMAKEDILNIDMFINEFNKLTGLISKWFFLWEINKIRVRIKTKNGISPENEFRKKIDELGYINKLVIIEVKDFHIDDSNMEPIEPFSIYVESKEQFSNERVLITFVNVMCEISSLAIEKFKIGKEYFNNFYVISILTHCIYNNFAGYSSRTELELAIHRLVAGIPKNYDFENKF
jgi:hypothetical protein